MAGIYIHIPFCIKKCAYCDFISFADKAECFAKSYCDALKKEIEHYAPKMKRYLFDTVFIGGGTPSVIDESLIKDVLDSVKKHFSIATDAEITIETNPGTLNEQKLSVYKQAGINRLSIGVQSADDEVLNAIGRIHTFEEAKNSFYLARKCGFDNINIDIMYALPKQSLSSYTATLNKIIELSPEHISAYSLILEEGTELYEMCNSKKVKLPSEDEEFQMHKCTITLLQKAGYERYEISNYAKSGFQCRHNLNYWQSGEYLGLGVAAHSAVRLEKMLERWSNTACLDNYISAPQKEETHEVISKEDEIFEFVMLSLRKTNGFALTEFKERFACEFLEKYGEKAETLQKKGWLCISDEWLKLTDKGLDMQNEALIELLY
ncbi:MAG: oxygen-independent coproporphyrinogen III oxidase [Clostridia bacterium]|nr:oxygen-independent coproporphyrinogen III oxidase [Clostridia bacterium]